MSSTRTWAVGTAVVSLLLIVASWFLLIGPKRSEAADLQSQKVVQDANNAQLSLKIAQLKAQFASLPAKQAELQVIKRQLPDNPALPTLIHSLSGIAAASGATLYEVSPQAPVAATVPATANGTGAATGATAQPAAGLVKIPITITVRGSYAENELFLQKLQTGITRALLVEQLSIKPNLGDATGGTASTTTSTGDALETVITGSVFVLQDTATAGATTTATGATGATTGATTGTTSTGSAS